MGQEGTDGLVDDAGTENKVGDSDASTAEVETPSSDAPAEEVGAETDGESETPAETETPSEPFGEEEGGETAGEESETSQEESKGKGAEKRIKKLSAKNFNLEQENERLRKELEGSAGEAPMDEPKEEDFENYSDYTKALAKYTYQEEKARESEKAKETSVRTAAQERSRNFEQRADIVREEKEDFDEVAKSPEMLEFYARSAPHVAEAVMESEKGAEIAYYLGSNQDVAVEMARKSPVQVAIEIGKLEAKFSQKPKPRATSKAPKPISPTAGGGHGGADEKPNSELTDEEWLARRNKTKKIR